MIGSKLHPREVRRLAALQTATRIHLAGKRYDVAEIVADAGKLAECVEDGAGGSTSALKRRGEVVSIAARISIASKAPSAADVIDTAGMLDRFVTDGATR